MRKITRALGMLHMIPERAYLKMAYRLEMGQRLNLDDPTAFNEKLQWLKLNGAMARFGDLADKAKARDYVRRVLGEEYLVPAVGVYPRPDQIPWAGLPPRFVVKCTHGSHCGLIVTDRTRFDPRAAEKALRRWQRRSWYWFGREPVYRGMEKSILVENYLGDGENPPADYKVMCFHGAPKVIQVHEKAEGIHTIDFYDEHGDRLNLYKAGFPRGLDRTWPPAFLSALLSAAQALAQSVDTPYLRTDFYHVGDGFISPR